MYESHFGLTAAPFSLNPDPAFFFGSRGHSNALSYLKFGVYQGEGFVVVTGEIGAGKTTLVRTLLSELDRDRIVAAQIVSTQLEAGDLLRSVALAFGIAPKSLSKAELIATIEAFLTLLVTENKRALLIVDEAQNLNREAVEELRMLSNFQLGSQALLQSFLVGQPELRVLLTSKPMEQFRQRVIASCHLGPMDEAETRAYIEHRMQQVGWTGNNPAFDDAAFARIFHWTAGIPRRVNLLCNRLLLGAYLSSQDLVDAATVDTIGNEVRSEVGDAATRPGPTEVRRPAAGDAAMPPAAPSAAVQSLAPAVGPLVVVAASDFDDVKLAALLPALKQHKVAPRMVRVTIGEKARYALNQPLHRHFGVDVPVVALEISEADPTEQIASVMKQFAQLVDEHRPDAVLVIGGSDGALACGLVGRKKGCRIVHVEAGARAAAVGVDEAANSVLLDRMADVFYPAEMPAYVALVREGVGDAHLQHVGSLLVDAVQAAAGAPAALPAMSQEASAVVARGYGLVMLNGAIMAGDSESITELLSSLHEISREKPLVWPMPRHIDARLEALDLSSLAAHERIQRVDPVGFIESVGLAQGAAFIVTDSRDAELVAGILKRRCLWVDAPHPGASVGRHDAVKPSGAGAAERTAEHLAHWLSGRGKAASH
ncbi:XrtA/PEP-CTERM system-associated ATPase [Piscinibacter sp. XHJ-5]|uniref:XrtA/PEP-CTERM system-associated ATPase n=1 Tax=Piscinibacter sp. XHJ-5 TaxID=3037797 RepID=UPI002452D19F|nr:XrtA/PEP-CTERM system-associated ATPase [Piscinibacter sp. XHJ-5]